MLPSHARRPSSILAVITSVVFLGSGATKLLGLGGHVDNFARWGYPPWFVFVIGSVEVVGAILLFVRPVSALAALALSVTMIGAIATRVRAGNLGAAVFPFGLLIALGIIAYTRWHLLHEHVHRHRVQP